MITLSKKGLSLGLYTASILFVVILIVMFIADNLGWILEGGNLGAHYVLGIHVLSIPCIILWLVAFLLNRNWRFTIVFWLPLGMLFMFIFLYPVSF